MNETWQQTKQSVVRSYQRSPLAPFWRWWRAELLDLLPQERRDWLTHQDERALAVVGDDRELLIWGSHQPLEADPIARFEADEEGNYVAAQLPGLLAKLDAEQPRVVAVLPRGQALVKQVSFPVAAEGNLRQVIAFEMDRLTPFAADQVYYDYRVLSIGESQLAVELTIVRRPVVDQLLERAAALGLHIDRVDVRSDDLPQARPQPRGVNLLPPALRAPRKQGRVWLNLGLFIAMLMLFVAMMYLSVQAREASLDNHAKRVDDVRAEAMAVADLRGALTEATEGANFLARKKANSVAVVDLINQITQALGDDTYLQRLQVNGDELLITGFSPSAAALIPVLEAVPFLTNPGFNGSVSPDPQSGKERFSIKAEIVADDVGGASNLTQETADGAIDANA